MRRFCFFIKIIFILAPIVFGNYGCSSKGGAKHPGSPADTAPDIMVKYKSAVIVSGESCNLGSIVSGVTGSPEIFLIENTGTDSLSIGSVSLTSGDMADFHCIHQASTQR